MQIYIDADACPVVRIVEKVAQLKGLDVTLVCDRNHELVSKTSKIIVVDALRDAADFKIVSLTNANDVVVTQDQGLASLVIAKGAHAINQNGRRYTKDNIDQLLLERHMAQQARKSHSKRHFKGPKKRKLDDDVAFEHALIDLLDSL